MIITGTGILSTLFSFMTMLLAYGIYNKLTEIHNEIKNSKGKED